MGDGIKGLFRSINKAPVSFPTSVLLIVSQKYVTAVCVEWPIIIIGHVLLELNIYGFFSNF